MAGMTCHFHMDEWCEGRRLSDGASQFTCARADGHPGGGPWSWVEFPPPPDTGLGGLAEELNLALELPAALASLGQGWFEYGLLERAYAERDADGFKQMVERWGHTALGRQDYSASTYIASTLGRLARLGDVAHHPGGGSGRWHYNGDMSWWSLLPAGPLTEVTRWLDVMGDDRETDRCREYVPGVA